jgi:hypothetical protein
LLASSGCRNKTKTVGTSGSKVKNEYRIQDGARSDAGIPNMDMDAEVSGTQANSNEEALP